MNQQLLIGIACALVFLAAACFLVTNRLAQRDLVRNMERVIRGEGQTRAPRHFRGLLVGAVRHLGTYIQRLSIFSPKDIAELERTARSAGLSPDSTVPLLIGGKLILMIGLPLVAYFLTRRLAFPWPIAWTCVGVAVGVFGPNSVIGYVRGKRTKALRLGLGDSLDLLVVCAEAGLGLESAIDRVSSEMRHSNQEVAQEFFTLGQDLRLSSDRGAALLRMGERTGLDSFQRLTVTLAQTLRYGTPLGQTLRLLAVEMRNDRMMRLEEKAARLPTLMMLPLALFILPCLFIVVAGPAALRIMSIMS